MNNLIEYKVTILADEEPQTLAVFASDSREAGIEALKQARALLQPQTLEIKQVVKAKYQPKA